MTSKNPHFPLTCRHTYGLLNNTGSMCRFYRALAPDVLVFTVLDIPAWYRMKGANVTADLASRVLAYGAITPEDLQSLARYEFLDEKRKKRLDPLAVPHTVALYGLGQLRLRLPTGTRIPSTQLRDCKEIRKAVFIDLDDMSRGAGPETVPAGRSGSAPPRRGTARSRSGSSLLSSAFRFRLEAPVSLSAFVGERFNNNRRY